MVVNGNELQRTVYHDPFCKYVKRIYVYRRGCSNYELNEFFDNRSCNEVANLYPALEESTSYPEILLEETTTSTDTFWFWIWIIVLYIGIVVGIIVVWYFLYRYRNQEEIPLLNHNNLKVSYSTNNQL